MRELIRNEMLAIEPLDELERLHLEDSLAWVDSGVELCRLAKPATPPRHLVSYFALVDAGHVLLVDHRNAQLWLPTGGHVDPGEHPRETVRRELREELGLEIDGDLSPPLMLTVTGTVGVTAGHVDVSLWYVVESDMRSQFIWDRGEFSDVRWFGFDDVPLGRSDPHMGRFIAKLMNLNLEQVGVR